MPLLRRRCRRIVVCDGEADGGFSFPSFNNAIRMAWIERNIRIEIDLADVQEAHRHALRAQGQQGERGAGSDPLPGRL